MNKPSCQQTKDGFTLIEVLIASLIFVVVITVATSVFVVNSTVGDKSRTIRELTQSARYGLESIAREAKNSKTMDATNNVLTINSKDGTTTKTYSLVGNQIKVSENGGKLIPLFPNNVIVENPEDWSVENIAENFGVADPINYPLIQIEMQLSYNLGTGKKSETYKQTYRTTVANRSYPQEDFQASQ